MIDRVLNLTKQLVSIPSISPMDLGCQKIICKRLISLGFSIECMDFHDTYNIWAYRGKGVTLAFSGHTDVVPVGNDKKWKFSPFVPTIHKGFLYGRGVSDMKGALAAMIIAVETFVKKHPNHSGRIAFLITSDEESKATYGTKKIVENLIFKKEKIDYCLIGEPSSVRYLGDVIKNGRRGSLSACLYIHGVQGHIAYPELADNPIHNVLQFLLNLLSVSWDNGNKYFPPTGFQIYEIHSSSNSDNMIPDTLLVKFNFRFGNSNSVDLIQNKVEKLLNNSNIKYNIQWKLFGKPFVTKPGVLTDVVKNVVHKKCGIIPKLSTTGGTSDGRFIRKISPQILELGLINKTIHQLNENVKISDLKLLSVIYEEIIKTLLL